MGYELEHHTEFDRLEKQATIATYDYRSELSGLQIENGAVILDAGCGSGVVSRYLASLDRTSTVVACDQRCWCFGAKVR
jgi:tRNA A58 N-methylase Trm61